MLSLQTNCDWLSSLVVVCLVYCKADPNQIVTSFKGKQLVQEHNFFEWNPRAIPLHSLPSPLSPPSSTMISQIKDTALGSQQILNSIRNHSPSQPPLTSHRANQELCATHWTEKALPRTNALPNTQKGLGVKLHWVPHKSLIQWIERKLEGKTEEEMWQRVTCHKLKWHVPLTYRQKIKHGKTVHVCWE